MNSSPALAEEIEAGCRGSCRGPRWSAVACLCAAGLHWGCLHVAEERAERDLSIGKAEVENHSIEVENGFAAVRRFEPGLIELWANAPSLVVRVKSVETSPRVWRVRLRNVLPDARLELSSSFEDAQGTVEAALEPSRLESSWGTERDLELELEPGRRLTMRINAADTDLAEPFEFIEFGDVQEAIDDVWQVFERMNQQTSARFVVMAGDITRRGSRQELERFQVEQSALRLPIYVTLGNHELGDTEVPYHEYFGRGNQSFSFHGVRFTLLDTASATLDPLAERWLKGWLGGPEWVHLVFMHIPPTEPIGVRNGAFASRAEAAKLLASLGRASVAATFYGHIHSYYAFENAGIPAFISGGGGAVPERFDGMGRHFLVVSVDPNDRRVKTRVERVD